MIGGLTKSEIEKFDGNNFSLWKINFGDLFVQNDHSLSLKGVVKKLSGMTDEDQINLNRKMVSIVHIFLMDSTWFNVAKENTTKSLWEKHGKLYETK